jgi:hypothetical protein
MLLDIFSDSAEKAVISEVALEATVSFSNMRSSGQGGIKRGIAGVHWGIKGHASSREVVGASMTRVRWPLRPPRWVE